MRRADRTDAGTVTAFVVGLALALVAVAGLVVDGGLLLAARSAALDEAQAAARAGAQAVDVEVLRSGGPVSVQEDEARRRVTAYLARTGRTGVVDVVGDEVAVHVEVPVRLSILGLFGVRPKVVRASGTARGVRAVGGEEL